MTQTETVKKTIIEQRVAFFSQQIEAANNQLLSKLSWDEQISIQQRIESLLTQMEQTEAELTVLESADPYLTKSVSRAEVFAHCSGYTSVLIVSDAGAARGHRSLQRIQATTEALFHLKQHTSLIAWLNPMPKERWSGSSAQIIAHLVLMYQMDLDGFNNAIDVVRGQPFHHYR